MDNLQNALFSDKLADLHDIQQADLLMKEWEEERKLTYSHEEMMNRYG